MLEETYPGETITVRDNGDMTVTVNGGGENMPVPAGVRVIWQ